MPKSHVIPGSRKSMETGWVGGWSGVDMHLTASEGCMGHGGVLIIPCPFALLVLYVVAYLGAGSISKAIWLERSG